MCVQGAWLLPPATTTHPDIESEGTEVTVSLRYRALGLISLFTAYALEVKTAAWGTLRWSDTPETKMIVLTS